MIFENNREVDYRYYLLDKNNIKKGYLRDVEGGSISYDLNSEIKRTAKFNIIDNGEIDFLSDRIMPVMIIREKKSSHVEESLGVALDGTQLSPEYVLEDTFLNPTHLLGKADVMTDEEDSRYVYMEYPLGVFVLSSPNRYDDLLYVNRDVEAYDLSILLRDYKVTKRFAVPEGANYITVAESLIREAGISDIDIPTVPNKTGRVIEYEAGTSSLAIVNDLLAQIGYVPINFTSRGVAVSFPFVDVERRIPTHKYHDNVNGVILLGAEEELDLSQAYNSFTVVRSNEDEKPLSITYLNNDINDPLSIPRRGRTISYFGKVEDASDESSLYRYVKMLATEHAMKLGSISFKTPNMPTHCCYNVIDFKYGNLGIEGVFLETAWTMELKVGGIMTHRLQSSYTFKEAVKR